MPMFICNRRPTIKKRDFVNILAAQGFDRTAAARVWHSHIVAVHADVHSNVVGLEAEYRSGTHVASSVEVKRA